MMFRNQKCPWMCTFLSFFLNDRQNSPYQLYLCISPLPDGTRQMYSVLHVFNLYTHTHRHIHTDIYRYTLSLF
ncbi:hypothetical protein BDF14DRAFT_1816696 [Spinellus fusiger]|nr:hypothetical protein BDF14DRAFT_1816696 [Spinellus fusiger]